MHMLSVYRCVAVSTHPHDSVYHHPTLRESRACYLQPITGRDNSTQTSTIQGIPLTITGVVALSSVLALSVLCTWYLVLVLALGSGPLPLGS